MNNNNEHNLQESLQHSLAQEPKFNECECECECECARTNRRTFLKQGFGTIGAAVTANFAMPFLPSLQALHADTIEVGDDYKALVCIMLSGDNDSFNMLVPTDSADYQTYRTTRNHLALDRDKLHSLDGRHQGKTFGLHPSMPKTQKLFNQGKLSFVTNIGALVEPTTKRDYQKNLVSLPLGLMSHADQLRHCRNPTQLTQL